MSEQVSADPRNRLISAAADLFHAAGYAAVGVQGICDAARVPRGSFYYYFDSKVALGLAAIERTTDRIIAAVHTPGLVGPQPPADRLARFVTLLERYYADRFAQLGVWVGDPIAAVAEQWGAVSPEMREKAMAQLLRPRAYYEAFTRAAIDRGDARPGDPSTIARHFSALVQGALLLAKLEETTAHLSDLTEPLGRIVGLRAHL